MFPQFREQIGTALDILVEFSTLGEYRLAADGALCPASALIPVSRKRPAGPGAQREIPRKRPARPGAQREIPRKRPARPGAQRSAPEREPQLGGAGAPNAARAVVRRIVAGGAADLVSAATPAARRVSEGPRGWSMRQTSRRVVRRRPAPVAPEQLCFAV